MWKVTTIIIGSTNRPLRPVPKPITRVKQRVQNSTGQKIYITATISNGPYRPPRVWLECHGMTDTESLSRSDGKLILSCTRYPRVWPCRATWAFPNHLSSWAALRPCQAEEMLSAPPSSEAYGHCYTDALKFVNALRRVNTGQCCRVQRHSLSSWRSWASMSEWPNFFVCATLH